MNPYLLERLVAERQAEYRRQATLALGRRRRSTAMLALAGALRRVADRLDGGRPDARWLGTLRVLD